MPYSPGLLPQVSWLHLMAGLPRHFGVDASLDAATAATLSAWLIEHAGTQRRAAEAPPDDRITRSAWFVPKHHEVTASTFKHVVLGRTAGGRLAFRPVWGLVGTRHARFAAFVRGPCAVAACVASMWRLLRAMVSGRKRGGSRRGHRPSGVAVAAGRAGLLVVAVAGQGLNDAHPGG